MDSAAAGNEAARVFPESPRDYGISILAWDRAGGSGHFNSSS
jgi:hypothetical protein